MSEKKTIAQLLAFNTEAAVQAIDATIRSVGKFSYHAQGTYGPYSFQDVVLNDYDGSQITAVFATRPELTPDWVGVRVSFLAARNDKGLYGLKTVFKEDKQSHTKALKLEVRDKAVMTAITDMAQGQAEPQASAPSAPPQSPPQAPQQRQAPPPRPTQQSAPSAPTPPAQAPAAPRPVLTPQQRIEKCRTWLESAGNFYQLAREEAFAQRMIWDKNHPQQPMTDAEFEKAIGGFCAGADKANIPSTMPSGDISQFMAK